MVLDQTDERGKFMEQFKLGDMEQKFASLIWEHEPVRSRELQQLCEEEFGWKKSTMYTMLKRLCDRGIFINQDGVVTSLMGREEFLAAQGEKFIQENFGGMLPKFLIAFTKRKKLSKKDIDEIRKIIDEYEEG